MRRAAAVAVPGIIAILAWQSFHSVPRSHVRASADPTIYLESARRVTASFEGAGPLAADLTAGRATALAMTVADVDGDGIADVVAAYAAPSGGALAIYPGNLDAFSPQTQASFDGIAHNRFPSPVMPTARTVATPARPDFVVTGDFSGNGRTEIAIAAAGDNAVHILSRGDDGEWRERESVPVAGAITAIAAEQLDPRHTGAQLLAGIRDARGSKLSVFTPSDAGMRAVETLDLPGDATSVQFADLDADGASDAAIVAGDRLLLLHGADFGAVLDGGMPQSLEFVTTSYGVKQLAIGNFIFDRSPRLQIAAVSTDGAVHILTHQTFDGRGLTPAEMLQRRQTSRAKTPAARPARGRRESWKEIENYTGIATSGATKVVRARITGNAMDDVMALNPGSDTLAVIAHPNQNDDGTMPAGVVLSRHEALAGLAAAVSTRVNVDARPGVLLLRNDGSQLNVMMPLPDPTFVVNTTLDLISPNACGNAVAGQCSLREAIIEANAAPGADTITLPAGTYTLTIAGRNENAAATGDLDITNPVTIVGAGSGTTIIQAGTNATNGIDKVLSINPTFGASFDASISGVTIRFGHNTSPITGDGFGGGFDYDSGTGGTGVLSLTDVIVTQNSTADGDGGGMAIFNAGGGASGVANLNNVTVSNNVAQESLTGGSGLGGGILVGGGAHIIVTGGSISSNQAIQNNVPPGQGGGVFIFGPGPAARSAFHGVTIQSNQAAGLGGGIYSTAGIIVDNNGATGSNISNNTATDGAGIWFNAENETTTITKSSFFSNAATGRGGAIEVSSSSTAAVFAQFNRFASNSAPTGSNLDNVAGSVAAQFNWWGTNTPATTINGTVNFTPWLKLTHTANPLYIALNGTSTLTASFLTDSSGGAVAVGNLDRLIGATITFNNAQKGNLSAAATTIQASGTATATFTGTANGVGGADATVDNATVTATVNIVQPPTLTKSFGAAHVALTGSPNVTLSFTLTNPNASFDFGNTMSFSDTFPAGLVVGSGPNIVSNTCSGVATAPIGSNTFSLSNNFLNAGLSCTVVINVKGTSDGVKNNTTGGPTGQVFGDPNNTHFTGATASASITVADPPTTAMAFGAPSITANGTTSLTITLSSTNPTFDLTGVSFTDSLPAGLIVATPGNPSTTCAGGTVTATDGSGTVSLSGATLTHAASCTVTVTVKGTSAGVKNNSTTTSSTEAGAGNTGSASVTVVGPPTLTKGFDAVSIPLNGSTTLSFTVTNPNTSTLNGVGFSDTLPAGLVINTPNGLTGTCGGGTITATQATSVVSLSGATLAGSASCTFSVSVTGTTAGSKVNTTGAVTSTEGGSGATATATLKVEAPPSVAIAFNPTSIAAGATSTLTVTITNPAANVDALTGVGLTDVFPGGMSVASPTGLTNSCGGTVAGGTFLANDVAVSNATIAAGAQCTISVNVQVIGTGQFTNVTNNAFSTNGGSGNQASATLTVGTPASISASFGAATIPVGGSTSLSFTINNPAGNVTLNGIAFTDSLPAGLVVSTPNGISGTCGGGTITATAGSGTVALSGASLATNTSCSFSVNVTGSTAGVKNNSVTVTSTEGGTGNTSNASVTVVAPPTISKSFGAASVPLNGSTSLTFTITNPNASVALTGVAFSDTLPAGLALASPSGLASTCGGVAVAASSPAAVSLSGGSVAASGTCTVSVNVKGTAAGSQVNTSGNITSTEGGTGGTATATVKVEAPPSIAKAFSPATIALNATSSLTFTITNPAGNVDALTGVAFTDTLPAGLTVVSGSTPTCGGTVTLTNPTTIALVGATIAAGGQCQFSVTVTGAVSGLYTNTTGNVSSTNGGTGNTATASLTVGAPPSISASFGAATIPVSGSTSLTFTVSNPAGNVSLNGIAFTDSLPAGLVVATPNGLSGSCGGGTVTAVAGSGSIALSGASLSSPSQCSFSVNVTGSTAGVKNNSVTVTSTEGGTGNTSNASITVVAPPTLGKAFGAASVPLNGATSLTFTVGNPNGTVALSGIAFSDTLPAGLVVATPNGLATTCGGTITATAATGVVSLSGATLAGAASCSFSVNVTGTAAGSQVNTSGTITSTEGGTGLTATATVKVEAPPSIAKAFNPTAIALNATTTLTFTITNPAGNVDALTGVAFTDNLPAGLTVATASATACGTGTATLTAPSTIALTGGAIAAGGQCQFNVLVTGAAAGQYSNTTGNVSSTNGGTGNTATATLTVAAPPSISKAFGAATIPLGGSTSLSFTIANPAANITLTGIAFFDNLPAGLVVANPAAVTGSCGGGTIAAVPGLSSVELSGATLATSTQCTFSVNVTGTFAGVKNNSVHVTSTEGGGGNTSTASITVVAPPTLSKAFGGATVIMGQSTSLTFTVTNPNATVALTGVAFSDTLPAGLTVASPNGLAGSCGGGTITAVAGSGSASLSGATLAASASCTFSVNVTGIAPGAQTNTTTVPASTNGGSGSAASASITVLAPDLTITKSHTGTFRQGQVGAQYTITVTNSGTAPTTAAVTVADTIPATLTVTGAAGTGWNCTTAISCTRSDVLAAGASYPPIVVTLNVGASTPPNVTNTATVSGGGEHVSNTGNNSASDPTVVIQVADMTITKSHSGNFFPGQGGFSYTLATRNVGPGISDAPVTVSDPLPAGLTLSSISGSGWTCTAATVSCTRADGLPPASSYPPITVVVSVAAHPPGTLANTATVSGGGEINFTNNSATDTQYLLTTLVSPPSANIPAVTPPEQFWPAGAIVTLVADGTSTAYTFNNWIGAVNAQTNPTTITMTGPQVVTANYVHVAAKPQTITFLPIPDHVFGEAPFALFATASSGLPVSFVVVSGPATISGNILTLTGTGTVVVRAIQNGNEFYLPADSVAQSFRSLAPAPNQYTLTLTASPAAGGSIGATPAGPQYPVGSSVSVNATANPGFIFTGFTGALSGLANPQSVVMSQNQSVTANFVPLSTDPADMLTFGFMHGFPLPGPQAIARSAEPRNAVDKSPRLAAASVQVVPGTGGVWMTAAPSATSANGVQVSLIPDAVAALTPGMYTGYVVATAPGGQPRAITVTLFVDIPSITKVVDAAGFRVGPISSQQLVTAFGINLAGEAKVAQTLPLGAALSGTTVTITDGAGTNRSALLLYAGPGQVNLLTPDGMAPGAGSITLINVLGQKVTVPVQVDRVSPGLFTANQDGKGVAAAVVLRAAGGTVTSSLAANCGIIPCAPNAIDVSSPTDQVFVSLYGTGIRNGSNVTATIGGISAEIQFSGAQSEFPGLDQVNVKLTKAMAGLGDVPVVVTVDGKTANTVSVRIQ